MSPKFKDPKIKRCKICRRTYERKNKYQLYCSKKCKDFNSRKNKRLKPCDIHIGGSHCRHPYMNSCKLCDEPYWSNNIRRRFCSKSCRELWYKGYRQYRVQYPRYFISKRDKKHRFYELRALKRKCKPIP